MKKKIMILLPVLILLAVIIPDMPAKAAEHTAADLSGLYNNMSNANDGDIVNLILTDAKVTLVRHDDINDVVVLEDASSGCYIPGSGLANVLKMGQTLNGTLALKVINDAYGYRLALTENGIEGVTIVGGEAVPTLLTADNISEYRGNLNWRFVEFRGVEIREPSDDLSDWAKCSFTTDFMEKEIIILDHEFDPPNYPDVGTVVNISGYLYSGASIFQPYSFSLAVNQEENGDPGGGSGPSTGGHSTGSSSGPSTGSPSGDDAGAGNAGTGDAGTGQEATVPVSSDKDTRPVPISVSDDGNATVKEEGAAALKEVLDGKNTSGEVVIDVSGIEGRITSVTIPSVIMVEIVTATNDENHDVKVLKISMTEGSITLDADALSAVADQAAGDDIRFHLESVGRENLNNKQKETVKGMTFEKVLDAFITGNGRRIGDFKGGKVLVDVPHKITKGKEKACHVWYIGDKGEKVRIPRQILDGIVRFVIDHMSNYVIEFDDKNLKDDDDLTFVTLEEPEQPAKKKSFTDVKEGDYFHDAVMWAAENGITAGVGDGTAFGTGRPVSRGQAVTFLKAYAKAADIKPAAKPYPDVNLNEWYAEGVAWAKSVNAIAGYDNGSFGPSDDVTRAMAATILRAYAKGEGGTKTFPDVTAGWQIKGVAWAGSNGIIAGKPDGTFDPDTAATREQFVVMLHALSKLSN